MKRTIQLCLPSTVLLLLAFQSCTEKKEVDLIDEVSAVYQVEIIAGSTTIGDTDGQGSEAQFTNIKQLALCPCSGVLFAYDNGKLKKITDKGIVQTVSGKIPDANPFFNENGGVTVARDGNIYVAGWKGIYKITGGQATILSSLVSDSTPFTNLGDLTSDTESNLYSVENTGLIRKITPQGQISIFFNSTKLWESVVSGPNGFLYLLDIQSRIYKMSPGGELTQIYPLPDQVPAKPMILTDIAVAADGTVYSAEDSKIHKITSNGIVSIHTLRDEKENTLSANEIILGEKDKVLYITDGLKIGRIKMVLD